MAGKRILTVADHLGSVGGTERAQLEICRGLAQRGWDIHLLYVSEGDYGPDWRSLATTTQRIGASLPSRAAPVASTVGAVRAAVAGMRARPSVVYVHNAGDVPMALAVATVVRAPVVAHLHLPPPVRQPEWLNASIRRASAVIVPSSDAAGRWVARAGLDPDRMTVAPTGVDTDRFVPLGPDERQAVRHQIGVADQDRMILYAGRIEEIKGVRVLVEAAGRMATPAHVVMCGMANDQGYLLSLQEAMRGSRATYLGRRSDVPSLMGAADLVVVPSSVAETQGLVISEALACGTPVVAFDVGGVADSMRDFADQLVPAGDAAQLTQTIERFVAWRGDDPDLGPRSRAWAVEHMSVDRSIDRVEAVIERAEVGAPGNQDLRG